jgi:hypothetical protein
MKKEEIYEKVPEIHQNMFLANSSHQIVLLARSRYTKLLAKAL